MAKNPENTLIIVALGANLPHPLHGSPAATLTAALNALQAAGAAVARRSGWWVSPAWPPGSDQPDYVNGAAVIESSLSATDLLALLHRVEAEFGRARGAVNAARTLDLDLISWRGQVRAAGADGAGPILPHPRWRERGFVLRPLLEVAPNFRCPTDGAAAADLLAALVDDETRPLRSA